MQTPEKRSARTQGDAHAEPVTLRRRIGPTTVEVAVHFSKTGHETMADIVRRLIPRDIERAIDKTGAATVVALTLPGQEVDKVA